MAIDEELAYELGIKTNLVSLPLISAVHDSRGYVVVVQQNGRQKEMTLPENNQTAIIIKYVDNQEDQQLILDGRNLHGEGAAKIEYIICTTDTTLK